MASQFSLRDCARILYPLISVREKVCFAGAMVLALILALNELVITGLVAVMAAVFSSPETVRSLRVFTVLEEWPGLHFDGDARFMVLVLLLSILGTILLKNGVGIVQQWLATSFSENVGNSLRARLLSIYLRAPYLWVVRQGASTLVFNLKAAGEIGTALLAGLQACTNMLMLAIIFAGLLSVSFLPSLIFFTALGLCSFTLLRMMRSSLDSRARAVVGSRQDLHRLELLALNALKEVRLHTKETTLHNTYVNKLGTLLKHRKLQEALSRTPIGMVEATGFSSLCLVLLFLIFIQDAGMTRIAGIMGFLAAAAWRCLPVANRLIEVWTYLLTLLPYVSIVAELAHFEKSFDACMASPGEDGTKSISFSDKIQFEDVNFGYPQAPLPALKNISLDIRAGQMIGIVGFSGSGKSTLVNLLTGLLTPDSGTIRVDGQMLNRSNIQSWLTKIGYVPQSPYILDASLAENIALSLGEDEIDRKRVLECCRMAVLDFVDQLKDGIDTMLGERGTLLSGGQAQRVAIARALYTGPELIIFDEATSALDRKNERAVHETILNLRSSVTVIIIAHRLSTVKECDTLVWLENGAIKEQGAPEIILDRYEAMMQEKQHQGFEQKDSMRAHGKPSVQPIPVEVFTHLD